MVNYPLEVNESNCCFCYTLRAVCGIRDESLIINLPGSMKASEVSNSYRCCSLMCHNHMSIRL